MSTGNAGFDGRIYRLEDAAVTATVSSGDIFIAVYLHQDAIQALITNALTISHG